MPSQKEESVSTPISLFSLFTLKQGSKLWGFRQMGLSGPHIARQKGIKFGLMLGTGQGRGFSMRPDLGRYALFTSWESKAAADHFLSADSLYQEIEKNSQEVFTTHLLPIMAKGNWKGQNPFLPAVTSPEAYAGPLVALTRARIRWQQLLSFWRNVPGVSGETERAKGLLAQTGMGEIPLIEQATLSIWENERSLKKFAYQMRQHKEVIRKTRSQNWYSEELFARFIPLEASGSWNGTNPLAGKCWKPD